MVVNSSGWMDSTSNGYFSSTLPGDACHLHRMTRQAGHRHWVVERTCAWLTCGRRVV